MGPREAKKAIELLQAPKVIPMHFGTFPLLTGTPAQLLEMTEGMNVEIVPLEPGETYQV